MDAPGERLLIPLVPGGADDREPLGRALESALGIGAYAGVLVEDWQGPGPLDDALRPLCQRAGVAFLVRPASGIALIPGVDGALLTPELEALAAARAILGPHAILGAACGLSRHDAMVAGEAGADFVAFEGQAQDPMLRDTLLWWSELFVLPSLALVAEPDDMAAGALARSGADFLAVPASVWNRSGGTTRLRELAAAFA